MPIENMTKEQIAEATRKVVQTGGKSTDPDNRLKGETASEANARITAAYKELTKKPILTQEQIDGGMKVQFVREGSGGFGEYVAVKPSNYKGPTKITKFTDGIVPKGSKYTTGSAVGLDAGNRTKDEYLKVLVGKLTAGNPLTAEEKAWLDKNGGTSLNPNVTKTKTVKSTTKNADGTITTNWSDGTTTTEPATVDKNVSLKFANGIMYNNGVPFSGKGPDGITYTNGIPDDSENSTENVNKSLVVSNTDENTTTTNPLDTTFTDTEMAKRKSAYELLYDEFDSYGLGTLVSDIKNILLEGPYDPSEFSIKVRGTDAYKARFIANEKRLAKGLKALSPAAYIALEDQYQEVMRQYGLPESYYTKSATGIQEGFNKLIENDVSNVELEDRISTAQKRVINANPEVTAALKQFYPDINNGDILAYTLDPKNAIENIKRKVTAAEIGGAAIQAGLGYKGDTPEAIRARAEELRAAGITKETAQQGYGTIAGGLQRGSQLAAIYGEDPYNQVTAEEEIFKLSGANEARKQRQKITGLEKATFGGQTGLSSGALVRDRAGAY